LQGHAVPAPLIQRFLEEVSRAARDELAQGPLHLRLPSLGCDYQSLEPAALRSSLRLGQRTGILVTRLHHPGQGVPLPSLQCGDVLLRFNGHPLDELGFCNLLGRRLHFAAARDLCATHATVPIQVWRAEAELQLEHALRPAQYLVPRGQFDTRPRYFACGGLVFQPLSQEYLQGWNANDRPSHLQNLFLGGHLTPERTEVVMLSQVLADAANSGYDSGWVGAPIIEAVNGTPIRSLAHLIKVVRAERSDLEGFLTLDVKMSSGPFRIVLPNAELDAADARISQLYGVPPSCCSSHYLDEAPLEAMAGV